MSKTVWICGQYLHGQGSEHAWSFQGVFDSEEKAVKACIDSMYFVAPTELNKTYPDEIQSWVGAYYPHE